MRRLTVRPNLAVFLATFLGALLALALPYLPVLATNSPPVARCSPPVGGMSPPVGKASPPVGKASRPVRDASPPVGDQSRPGHGFGDPNRCHTGPPGR